MQMRVEPASLALQFGAAFDVSSKMCQNAQLYFSSTGEDNEWRYQVQTSQNAPYLKLIFTHGCKWLFFTDSLTVRRCFVLGETARFECARAWRALYCLYSDGVTFPTDYDASWVMPRLSAHERLTAWQNYRARLAALSGSQEASEPISSHGTNRISNRTTQ